MFDKKLPSDMSGSGPTDESIESFTPREKPKPKVEPSPPMEYVAVQLPPQPDAPNVFRYSCPACKCNVSLYGRMGSWFVKAIGR